MKQTTAYGTWALIAIGAALLWCGTYWFYRVPPKARPVEGYSFVNAGPVEGGIVPIDVPAFESVAAADQYLNDKGEGLDVEVDGEHRFYPYQILVWHEIVNDSFDNVPVLISYSPLTDTGMAFRRDPNGEALTFSVSDFLWNNNSVLTDTQTNSHWIQVLGKAVDGERSGTVLAPVMARTMSWSAWKQANPKGEVLSRETGVSRDYTRNPYGNYASTPAIWYGLTSVDSRLNAKTRVYTVSVGTSRAVYAEDELMKAGNVRETVDNVPIEVTFDEDLGTARAYRLEMNGEPGEELVVTRGFWFLWSAAYPGVHLYDLP
jgi:hypothetical protein